MLHFTHFPSPFFGMPSVIRYSLFNIFRDVLKRSLFLAQKLKKQSCLSFFILQYQTNLHLPSECPCATHEGFEFPQNVDLIAPTKNSYFKTMILLSQKNVTIILKHI